MRNFDLAPLYRATVGFDQIADMMDRVLTQEVTQPSYPLITLKKPLMMRGVFRSPLPGFQPKTSPSSSARMR